MLIARPYHFCSKPFTKKPPKFFVRNLANPYATITQKINNYYLLARADKPIGTMLLLWPCVWSISFGFHQHVQHVSLIEYFRILGIFGLGAFVMRSSGCIINDLADRNLDKLVQRTSCRPIASGKVTPFAASVFLGVNLALGLLVLLQLNLPSIMIGICSLPIICIYPFMKRYTYWPQFILGLAFNYGALIGYTALTGSFNNAVTLSLYAGGVFWTLIYDTIYAHQDKIDDIKANIKSTALKFGDRTKSFFAFFSVGSMSMFYLAGYHNNCTLLYHALITALCGGHYIWQIRTLDINNPDDCWAKFKSNNIFGAFVAFSIIADSIYILYRNPSSEPPK